MYFVFSIIYLWSYVNREAFCNCVSIIAGSIFSMPIFSVYLTHSSHMGKEIYRYGKREKE